MIYLFTFSCAIHHLTKRSHLTRGSKQIFLCVVFLSSPFSILRPRIVFSAEGETLPLHRISQDFSATLSANLRLKLSTTTTFFSTSLQTLPPSFLERFSIACGCDPSNREKTKKRRRQLHHYTVQSSFYFFSCAIEKRKYFT